MLLLIIIFLLFYIIHIIISENKNRDNVSHNKDGRIISAPQRQKARKGKLSSDNQHQKISWNGKFLDTSMIPNKVELNKDTLLPQLVNRKYGYGKRFNSFLFIGDNTFYHKSNCPKSSGKHKKLIHRYIAFRNLKPCPDCNPKAYIDEWYIDFIRTNFGAEYTSENCTFQDALPGIGLPSSDKRLNAENKIYIKGSN